MSTWLDQLPEAAQFALGIAALAALIYSIYLYYRWVSSVQDACGIRPFGIPFWIALAGVPVFVFGLFSETNQPTNFQVGSLVLVGCYASAVGLLYGRTRKVLFSIVYPLTILVFAAFIVLAIALVSGQARGRTRTSSVEDRAAAAERGRYFERRRLGIQK